MVVSPAPEPFRWRENPPRHLLRRRHPSQEGICIESPPGEEKDLPLAHHRPLSEQNILWCLSALTFTIVRLRPAE